MPLLVRLFEFGLEKGSRAFKIFKQQGLYSIFFNALPSPSPNHILLLPGVQIHGRYEEARNVLRAVARNLVFGGGRG